MNTLSTKQIDFLRTLLDTRSAVNRDNTIVTRQELLVACDAAGIVAPPIWIVMDPNRRVGRGLYKIDEITEILGDKNQATKYNDTTMTNTTFDVKNTVLAMTNGDRTTIIPVVCKEYVPWGHFNDIEALISTKDFMTIYITGMSGNGKTTMVEQICAKLKRECFRVNIIGSTDEDDLFGGMRLNNGSTTWEDGPVIQAMKRGAVLLLDEVDLGSEKLMCLQPVLEGKGVYVKKKNEWVVPAEGFCVIATANTKGKGSDDGRFVGTQIMNEAFLDRFDYTYEQEYAPKKTEVKILNKAMAKYGLRDDKFVENLVTWADMIRKSYADGAVTEIISTRRLLNIIKAYSVFNDKNKSVSMSLARFDAEFQGAALSLYNKISDDKPIEEPKPAAASEPVVDVPF